MNKIFLVIPISIGIVGLIFVALMMYGINQSRYYEDTEELTDTSIGGPIDPDTEELTDTSIGEPTLNHNTDESNVDYDDYTVLVYMVASNLEDADDYAATDDLYEMRKIGSGNKINVIVESGGSYATSNSYRILDFNTVKRLYIEKENIEEISDLGKQNMGDPETLSDFLIWGTTNYPAKKYIVILWDHGSGFKGYGYDEIFEDSLSLDEIYNAFFDARDYNENIHFEVVGFDACLMASIEVADALQEYTNYLVASEEVEPTYGWDYTAILSSLHRDHKQSGASIGKIIADSYFKHTEAYTKEYGSGNEHFMITLSVIDMSKLDSLKQSINKFNEGLKQLGSDSLSMLSQGFYESERYGVKIGRDSGHTDIQSVANHVGNTFNSLKDTARSLKRAVNDAVVYNVHGISRPESAGISLYFPLTSSEKSTSFDNSRSISFNENYQDYLTADTMAPELNVDYDGHTIEGNFVGDDVYSFKIFITTVIYKDLLYVVSSKEYNPYDFPNGNFELDWDGTSESLCFDDDCTSYINPEYEYGGNRTLLHVPVKVQSGDVFADVDLVFDQTDDVFHATFNGAWVVDKDEKLYQKKTIRLKEGDLIYPYLITYDPKTENIVYILSDQSMTMGETVSLDLGFPINTVVYQYIQVCDYNNNCDFEGPFRTKV